MREGGDMPTGIEWADEVINPVVGCSRVSAGCCAHSAASLTMMPLWMPMMSDFTTGWLF